MPPHDSPLALSRSTPSSVAFVDTGYEWLGLVSFASSAPVAVRILNVEPGGWRPESPMPEAASTPPVRGSMRDDAAEAVAERLHGGASARRSRSSSAPARAWTGTAAAIVRLPGPQLAAGAAEEPLVEDPLEAADADDRVGRDPERREVGLAVGRDRAERAGDRGRERAERGGAGLAAGQRGLVAREERAAGRQPRLPRELLAAAQPGEDEVVGPVDPGVGDRDAHGPAHRPPDAGLDAHGDAVRVAVALRPAGHDAHGGRRVEGALVGARERAAADAGALRRRELAVHRRVVAGGPLLGEALDRLLRGRDVQGAGQRAAGEGEDRDADARRPGRGGAAESDLGGAARCDARRHVAGPPRGPE